jgi:hypothetical protein
MSITRRLSWQVIVLFSPAIWRVVSMASKRDASSSTITIGLGGFNDMLMQKTHFCHRWGWNLRKE